MSNIPYKRIIILIIALILLVLVSPVKAEAPMPVLPDLYSYSTSELISHFATKYQVSAERMTRIQDCESDFNDLAHNYRPYAEHPEDSWGRSQINLMAHKDVTKEQATDRVFATEYLAKHLALKDVNWSCK